MRVQGETYRTLTAAFGSGSGESLENYPLRDFFNYERQTAGLTTGR